VRVTFVPLEDILRVPVGAGGGRYGKVGRRALLTTLGERVMARRLGLGLTRAELAALADISFDTLVGVEQGRHEPRAGTLAGLAAALDTTMDALWRGDADDARHPG